MLGVFAEFETNLRRERQTEGISKAKASGVYKGRPATVDRAGIVRAYADGMQPKIVARNFGCALSTVYEALRQQGLEVWSSSGNRSAAPVANATARRLGPDALG
jgi:DNA invertase Pin-like site-specific DNA recombinase